MTWINLGTVNLNYEWQLLPVPSFTAKTFKIIHINRAIYHTKALIAQSFGNEVQIYKPRGFYASQTPKIYNFFMPEEFVEENFSRFIALKLSTTSRVFDFNWQVQIEAIINNIDRLQNIELLAIENRGNIALLQQTVDRIEQGMDTTAGQ